MRPPAFWFTPPETPTWAARLLTPLAALYSAGTARRVAQPASVRPTCPVICIGNLNAGGTGKTPTVIALQMALSARGVKAHVVSRGYGGKLAGPIAVDPRRHNASQVGDEPLLLAAFGPTWVAKDRAAGARAAQAAGAQAILLDDGFQNPAIARDFAVVVVDAHRGFGNGRVLPAGPLREPVATGLARADMVLSIGPEPAQARFSSTWGTALGTLPHVSGHLAPLQTGMDWAGLRAIAFAGIGHPEKFFDTLRREGVTLCATHPLDDHQPLDARLITRLLADANAQSAQLVTTEKDAVRLPADLRGQVLSLPVRLELDDAAPLNAALDRLFGTA